MSINGFRRRPPAISSSLVLFFLAFVFGFLTLLQWPPFLASKPSFYLLEPGYYQGLAIVLYLLSIFILCSILEFRWDVRFLLGILFSLWFPPFEDAIKRGSETPFFLFTLACGLYAFFLLRPKFNKYKQKTVLALGLGITTLVLINLLRGTSPDLLLNGLLILALLSQDQDSRLQLWRITGILHPSVSFLKIFLPWICFILIGYQDNMRPLMAVSMLFPFYLQVLAHIVLVAFCLTVITRNRLAVTK